MPETPIEILSDVSSEKWMSLFLLRSPERGPNPRSYALASVATFAHRQFIVARSSQGPNHSVCMTKQSSSPLKCVLSGCPPFDRPSTDGSSPIRIHQYGYLRRVAQPVRPAGFGDLGIQEARHLLHRSQDRPSLFRKQNADRRWDVGDGTALVGQLAGFRVDAMSRDSVGIGTGGE